ncbi:UDP-glucose dehydrogenase family protein [Streptomyces sp. NPDC059785]|uniref:UDP-glucose dehydrogenase family protein n=1 Tax=unclassified Streptomyces TaxID=2593676 RepID=UPI0036689D64
MHVAVVGQGYVGLTGAVALTLQGHHVTGVEQLPARLSSLRSGQAPVFEPGLPEQLAAALATGRLAFTDDLTRSHAHTPFDMVLIAVGTPPSPTGAADLSQVHAVLDETTTLTPPPLVVLKSTVPPGTSSRLAEAHPGLRDRYAYNPEFLNQGSALEDWATPARIVAGTWHPDALHGLQHLYTGVASPWVATTPTSAELVKYASNAYLATKISFANEISRLCHLPDADIDQVMRGVGYDPRIGHAFLQPGIGYGDSCLPKDTAALAHWAAQQHLPTPLLHATIGVNDAQLDLPLDILDAELGDQLVHATVAVLGVRYEPWSDDLRAAPSRHVVPALLERAAHVRVWDPSTPADTITHLFPGAHAAPDLTTALTGAHAAVLLTEWPQTVETDWSAAAPLLTAPRLVIDGKNCLHPEHLAGLPIRYRSIGNRRPTTHNPNPNPDLTNPQYEA